jgi:hypothetical protein
LQVFDRIDRPVRQQGKERLEGHADVLVDMSSIVDDNVDAADPAYQ